VIPENKRANYESASKGHRVYPYFIELNRIIFSGGQNLQCTTDASNTITNELFTSTGWRRSAVQCSDRLAPLLRFTIEPLRTKLDKPVLLKSTEATCFQNLGVRCRSLPALRPAFRLQTPAQIGVDEQRVRQRKDRQPVSTRCCPRSPVEGTWCDSQLKIGVG
jgi:hypothetical protein